LTLIACMVAVSYVLMRSVASQCALLGLGDILSHAVGRQTTESRAVKPAHIEPVPTCSCFLRSHAAITGDNAATDCIANEFRCGRNEHRPYPLSFVIAPYVLRCALRIAMQ